MKESAVSVRAERVVLVSVEDELVPEIVYGPRWHAEEVLGDKVEPKPLTQTLFC